VFVGGEVFFINIASTLQRWASFTRYRYHQRSVSR
jgi:hypothetical protein